MGDFTYYRDPTKVVVLYQGKMIFCNKVMYVVPDMEHDKEVEDRIRVYFDNGNYLTFDGTVQDFYDGLYGENKSDKS